MSDSVVPTDLEAFRAEVRAFVQARAPRTPLKAGVRAPENEKEQAELRAWGAELYAAGYTGGGWPAEFGGRGAAHDPRRDQVVAEELALARAPGGPPGNGLAAAALIGFGSAAQQASLLPGIRSGRHVWCQLFSEPGAGSDLAGMRTRAVLDGDEYVVNGQKVWTTNGHWADYGYLLARTDPSVAKHRGISAFALEMTSPGITVRPLRELTGTADFNEVFFDDVRVPASALIGALGQGWAIANASLAHERSGVGAGVVTLRETWAALWRLASSSVSGEALADADGVRTRLLGFYAEIESLAALVRITTERWQDGSARPGDAPMTKLMFSEVNLGLARFAVELLGPAGVLVEGDPSVVDEGRWQDNFLYAPVYTVAGGSSEIMRNVIAERALGLPRDVLA